jgi:hypothetical protein
MKIAQIKRFLGWKLLLPVFLGVSLSTASPQPEIAADRGERVFIHKTHRLDGQNQVPGASLTVSGDRAVYNFENRRLIWKGEGECNQQEGQPPMFEVLDHVTIRNAYIYDAPDGWHIKGDNVILQNCHWMRICEDALSVSKADTRGLLIERCSFFEAEDKAIQLNTGSDLEIRDCVFWQTSTAIKLDRGPTGVRIHSNLFLDSDVAIHLSGEETRASSIRNNTFEDVGVFLKIGNGAVARLSGGNHGSAVDQAIQLRDGGRLVVAE